MSQEKGRQHVVSVQTELVEAYEGIATVSNVTHVIKEPKMDVWSLEGGERTLQWRNGRRS